MEYIQATEEDTEQIAALVQETIRTIYRHYYLGEIVDFFCELHCVENIRADIVQGNVRILLEDGVLVGTGSREGNHITRVYVAPECQGRGYGSVIMKNLEDELAAEYDTAILEASLAACRLYERRGYRTVTHGSWNVGNGIVFIWEIMEKTLLPMKSGGDGRCSLT